MLQSTENQSTNSTPDSYQLLLLTENFTLKQIAILTNVIISFVKKVKNGLSKKSKEVNGKKQSSKKQQDFLNLKIQQKPLHVTIKFFLFIKMKIHFHGKNYHRQLFFH